MKFAFFNFPAYGHVNPTLAIVRELVARGETVVYYLTDTFRQQVEEAGATFHAYTHNPFKGMGQGNHPFAAANAGPAGFDPARMLNALPVRMITTSSELIPELLESVRAEEPDCIVYDGMFLPARFVAQILHIPAITLRPSYAMNEHVNMFRMMAQRVPMASQMFETLNASLHQLTSTYQLPETHVRSMMTYAEPLNIVFLPRAFQPSAETFDQRFLFVGPSFEETRDASNTFPLDALTGQRPILYISLGTVFNFSADFFNLCFDTFGSTEWQVVLSLGKNVDQAALHAIPQNFVVAPYVPQLQVLARASIFVSHGGMNSTMESLSYGVPLVVVPQMPEQEMTARRIQELHLGIFLDKTTLTGETLHAAVEQVAHDQTYRTHTQEMQHEIRKSGGYQQAANAIIDYGRTHAVQAIHS